MSPALFNGGLLLVDINHTGPYRTKWGHIGQYWTIQNKQAGAELGQAQDKLKVIIEVQVKVAAEVEVSVNHYKPGYSGLFKGFLDFSCGGGWVVWWVGGWC